MTGWRHEVTERSRSGAPPVEMTSLLLTKFFLAKTLDLLAVIAWLSVNHGAVTLVDRFVRCREHAFANSDR
jgi:hypothetical protein